MAKPKTLLELLLANPIMLAIVAVIIIAMLIIGIVALTLLKLWTGVIIGGVLLVIVWVLFQTKALPTEKYPWIPIVLMLIPIFGFLFGVWGERTGAFYVTPLMDKPEAITPYYAAEPMQVITANSQIILIFILMICIAVAFARPKG